MLKVSHPQYSNKIKSEIDKILRSGNLTQGKYVNQLEKKIRNYFNTKYALALSSGTAALHLSLLAKNIKESDEIIIPAFSYIATANVIELVKAKPILVDVNMDDFCINTDKIEKVISKKTKAIMPVHEFGMPSNLDKLENISKKYNIELIEDCACAFGSKYKDKFVGAFGVSGCFSLHPRKTITSGEGGILITNKIKIYNYVKSMRSHGINLDFKRDYIYAGLNYRMTEIQAALGLDELNNYNKKLRYRLEIVKIYQKYLSEIKWIKIPNIMKNRKSIFQSYHIVIKNNVNRDHFIEYLNKNNIQAVIGAQAIHEQSYYKKKYKFKKNDYPNASNLYHKGLCLPLGSHVKKRDVINIFNLIKRYEKKFI